MKWYKLLLSSFGSDTSMIDRGNMDVVQRGLTQDTLGVIPKYPDQPSVKKKKKQPKCPIPRVDVERPNAARQPGGPGDIRGI